MVERYSDEQAGNAPTRSEGDVHYTSDVTAGATETVSVRERAATSSPDERTELLRLWGELEPFVESPPPISSGGTPLQTARERFASLFREELAIVQAVRNSAAHSVDVDPELVRQAVELARELVKVARKGESIAANRVVGGASSA